MQRLSTLILVLVIFSAAPMNTNAAAAEASLTIHYRNCPYGYTHQEYFKLCHDNPLVENTMGVFSEAGYIIGKTDENGNITFQLDPGTYHTYIGIARDFSTDEYVYCTKTDRSGEVPSDPLVLKSGDNVTCDYYYVGGGGRSSPPSEDTLPPGAGHVRYFYALSCEGGPAVVDFVSGSFPPPGCVRQPGIRLTVTAGDEQPIGSCTTEDSGFCALHVFVNVVIVTEDTNTGPLTDYDYAPQANPILHDFGSGSVHLPAIIVNAPANLLPTIAPANSSITVHGRVCPPGYAGTDYFADCHGNIPDYQQMMFLSGQLGGADYLAKPIDTDGNVTFSELLPERYHLLLGLPSDTASTFVACAEPAVSDDVIDTRTMSSTGWSSTAIDLGPHEDLVCDAYTIPPAA